MAKSALAYRALESVFGRHLLWRVARHIGAGARREVHADPSSDGEFALQRWALAQGPEAPVFLDIGANHGLWSINMAREAARAGAASARFLAFEPAPMQRQTLLSALEEAGIDTVTVLDCALSDAVGTVQFEVMGDAAGSNAILSGERRKTDSKIIETAVSTLDLTMAEHGIEHVRLAKIDTEGYDLQVIRGAETAMSNRAIDIIQFEYSMRWVPLGHSLYRTIKLARERGYSYGKLTPDCIEVYDSWHPEMERFVLSNHVLIAPGAENGLPLVHMRFDASNVPVPA